jgi:hypothetical protein
MVNYLRLNTVTPSMSVPTNNTMNTVKSTLAIPAAADSIPVNPKMAATMAMMKNMTDHFNMISNF